MAATVFVTAEQYLSSHFEREPELAHGELSARPLPTCSHGRAQQRLALHLDPAGCCCTEVRMRLPNDAYRIPDVAVFAGAAPVDEIPSSPPLIVVEISSPDDRFNDMLAKLEEYRAWGVQHIWLLEPELKRLQVYANRSLIDVARFDLPQSGLSVTAEALFA